MKATELFKLYATEEEAAMIRRKCNRAGVSASRFGVTAMLHWSPNRSRGVRGGNSPRHGPSFAFPGRAAMPMRL